VTTKVTLERSLECIKCCNVAFEWEGHRKRNAHEQTESEGKGIFLSCDTYGEG
jgi:hypothetical protein